jgi:hypothetical protein
MSTRSSPLFPFMPKGHISNETSETNIKSIKKLDLDSIQKPKTLIIAHYKNKRISIPLFEEVFHIT